MKRTVRVLTREDRDYVPELMQIFYKRLGDIARFYNPERIQNALSKFTVSFAQNHLSEEEGYRLVGSFEKNTPVGVLIERDAEDCGEDYHFEFNHISWMAARESGKGIGSQLLNDCIERSRKMDKNYVTLNVSEQNFDARRLYERKGFIYAPVQPAPETRLKFMGFPLKQ
jgi:ribosomal protein S18 acetylase RimI-like enzyme